MSALAPNTDVIAFPDIVRPIKERLSAAREERKKLEYEPTWQSNLGFAAGKFHQKWDRDRRALVVPPDLYGKDMYDADIITTYRTTALGELSADDDRPELLLRRDDEWSEDFQRQLNKALAFGWDHEWKADEALEIVRRMCVDLGTAAIQCYFDPTVGPIVGEMPHLEGKPVYDVSQQAALVDQFQAGPIPGVEMRPVRQGHICWRPLSPFNLLVPPGIPDEAQFPWECVVRPVPLQEVKDMYGHAAADLKEDRDIGSLLGLNSGDAASSVSQLGSPVQQDAPNGGVRDHVWLFQYFERPTSKYPRGRVVTLASNKMVLVDMKPELPYVAPDGSYRSGIHYFHWWRVTGRFYSRGLVDVLKDPQRIINEVRRMQVEINRRGLPFVLVEEGEDAVKNRKGLPVEVVPIKKQGSGTPVVHPGVGPGGWMQALIDGIHQDVELASGIHGPRIGDNPANVTTYSQLALIAENDQTKRNQIYRSHKLSIARLVEDAVHDMRAYWGPQKQIDIAGDDNRVDSMVFNSTKIPAFFIVQVPRGSVKPRNQAAELTKVEQLWGAALNSQAILQNPQAWINWYAASLSAGQPLELPNQGADAQTHKANLENQKMLQDGVPVSVSYFDPIQVHIPIHREAQIQAELTGDMHTWQVIEAHVQAHLQNEQQNHMQIAQQVQDAQQMPGQPQPTPVPDMSMGQAQQDNSAQQLSQLAQAAQQMHQQQAQHEQRLQHQQEQHQQRMAQARQQAQNKPKPK